MTLFFFSFSFSPSLPFEQRSKFYTDVCCQSLAASIYLFTLLYSRLHFISFYFFMFLRLKKTHRDIVGRRRRNVEKERRIHHHHLCDGYCWARACHSIVNSIFCCCFFLLLFIYGFPSKHMCNLFNLLCVS